MTTNIHKLNGFIYVTSEDEIKQGDYYIDFMCDGLKLEHFKTKEDWVLVGICNSKKVILTNDRKLTNVQRLTPEEEAYCKTVDSVEVVKEFQQTSDNLRDGFYYKLQLPKQETIEAMADEYSSQAIWKCGESWKYGYNEAVKTLYNADDMINFANLFAVVEVNNEHLEFFNQNK